MHDTSFRYETFDSDESDAFWNRASYFPVLSTVVLYIKDISKYVSVSFQKNVAFLSGIY